MSDSDLVFYYSPRTRAETVHWLLEELDVPYERHLMSLQAGDQKKPDFLALNPMGKVPVIAHGGVAVSETAAICCYLADAFPDAGLAPAIGNPRRGPYLKWLFFAPGCMEPALSDRVLKRDDGTPGQRGYGTFEDTMEAVAAAVDPGPYLFAEQFTAADVVIGAAVRWANFMGVLPDDKRLTGYLEHLDARPAARRWAEKSVEAAAQQEAQQAG